jgi:hypothetical protein
MGMIYKRGKTFWIKYYRNGKPFYESAKSGKESDANALLKRREARLRTGNFRDYASRRYALTSLPTTSRGITGLMPGSPLKGLKGASRPLPFISGA